MISLPLHEFHARHGAVFAALGEAETVAHYGDAGAEHATLLRSAGLIDLSFRSRLWLTGSDRLRFLNGQVTNNVKDLAPGQGCYAALVTAKGRMESDLNVICLEGGLLLDFEPGLSARVAARLEKYIIADDVQVADVAPHYGLLAVHGPRSADVVQAALPGLAPSEKPLGSVRLVHPNWGEMYCVSHPRGAQSAFDLYVPARSLMPAAEGFLAAVQSVGGGLT
ncbi:MAG TPA: aminomethyl transferase family protein, partial [Methylomirabilota bacterium]|nr:aminomethyl transferase family protein [Methylomirabilota bacterium]